MPCMQVQNLAHLQLTGLSAPLAAVSASNQGGRVQALYLGTTQGQLYCHRMADPKEQQGMPI